MTGDCKLIESSARTDHKGTCNRRKDCQKFFSLWEDPLLNTGYNQDNNGGKILQNGSCSGIGIIDRHKKAKLCQAGSKQRKEKKGFAVLFGFPDRWTRLCILSFLAKQFVQYNQDQSCADLPDTEHNRGWEGKTCSRYCPEHPESPHTELRG